MSKLRLRSKHLLWVMLIAALLVRMAVILIAFQSAETFSGDGPFYLSAARYLDRLWFPADTQQAITSIGPLYPLFLSPLVHLIPKSAEVAQLVSVRLAQAGVDTLTVLLVYVLARHLFGERAGRIALVAQAFDPRYLFTNGAIATETLFIALFIGSLLAYLWADEAKQMGRYALSGVLLGLAVLTRPIPLLFPLVLLAHTLIKPQGRRQALRGWAALMVAMAVVVTPWMVRTALLSGKLIPVSDTAFVHFWRASREDGDVITSDIAIKEAAEEDNLDRSAKAEGLVDPYVAAGLRNVLEKPLPWLERTVERTVASYLQPYGTVILTPRGAGVRQKVQAFLAGEASLGEVLAVPGLWRRLLMYIWHYWGLIGGAAGLALILRQRWRELLPLWGWVVYLTGVTAPLLIEPRYVFPAMFALTILAAHATSWAWDALRVRRRGTQ